MSEVTVLLSTPVLNGETTISELTFRKPTVGDLIIGENFEGRLAAMTAILASISDVPLSVFKKIGAADFKKIAEATASLLGNDKAVKTGH